MLTEDQLADQLRAQLRREVAAIDPRPDLLASVHRQRARRSLALRAGAVAVPAAAAAAAIAMIMSAGGGAVPAKPGKPAILTAAMVRQMASESRSALAKSGLAVISYRLTDNRKLTGTGSERITFAGHDWNDVISQSFPASDGTPAHTQTAINRIIGKQFYLHVEGADGKVHWFRDTNPAGHPSIKIADPRTLFGLLNPSAAFKVIGFRTVGGVRLTVLSATMPPRLHDLGWLPGVGSGARVKRLVVWVDRHHVVHRMILRVVMAHTTEPIYLKKLKNGHLEFVVPSKAYLKKAQAMARKIPHATAGIDPSLSKTVRHDVQVAAVSVDFSRFGKILAISAPKHAIPEFTRG
jgi:hypothetical protein